MKGGRLHIWRGNKLSFTLIALICTTLIVWALERTPLLTTFLPTPERFGILSPVTLAVTPVSEYAYEQPTVKEDLSVTGRPRNLSAGRFDQAVGLPPRDSSTISSFEKVKEDKDFEKVKDDNNLEEVPREKKECNYAKGKWVADSRRPLYSGSGCKQWLSAMWACRLMQRPDFTFESFRWQPQGCEMPEFNGSEFLRRMEHKTFALVGDSLGRQQFQSLMCMVTGGKYSPEVENVGKKFGLVKAHGAVRPDGWAYRFPSTNTTILYYWSASLCELEPLNRSDPATHYALHLDRPATFLKQYLKQFDVLVLNTGHHWNRGKFSGNHWEMYAGGKAVTDKKLADIRNAKRLAIHSAVKWVDSQIPRHPRVKAFFRTISPRHFVNGDWNTGGSCLNTIPLANGSKVVQDGSIDTVAEGAVKGTRVKLLDVTALSQLRDEGHISKYFKKAAPGVSDCLHWCLPGIPDTWNEIIYAQL